MIKFKIPVKGEARHRRQNSKFKKSGFSLLEVLVAIAVIFFALVGSVSLVTTGIFNFSLTKNKIVANNLAQEGIEIVRAVRENNILCDVLNGAPVWEWNRDPEGGLLTTTSREVDANANLSIICGASTIITPRLPVFSNQKLRFDPASGFYGFTGTVETIFVRRIDISVSPASADPDIPPGDQMDIVSTVTWVERGATKSIVLRERLYKWR